MVDVKAAVIAALVGATLVMASPAQATFGGRPGLIAYESGFATWFTVRPDGGGKRKILSTAISAQWAPGGARLVFSGATDPLPGLWTARADGSRRRRILNPEKVPIPTPFGYAAEFPTWAPGARRIAFEADLDSPDPVRPRICIFSGHGRVRLVRIGGHPTWSPDGRSIAFDRLTGVRGTARSNIAVMRPSGRGFSILVHAGGSERLVEPDFSPDGHRAAFLDDTFDANGTVVSVAIQVVNRRTQRVTTVVQRPVRRGQIDPVRWTPNGRRLVYLQSGPIRRGTATGPAHLYTIRPDGTGRVRVLTFSRGAADFTWQSVR